MSRIPFEPVGGRGRENGADLLSCMTWQETHTWLEYLIIPVMVFCLISFLPASLVVRRKSLFSKFAGGGGQFLFFRQESLSGHRRP